MKSLPKFIVTLFALSAPFSTHGAVITAEGSVSVTTSATAPGPDHVVAYNVLPPDKGGSQVGARWRTDLANPDTPYRVDLGQNFKAEHSFTVGQITILTYRAIEVTNQFTLTLEAFTERSRERPDFDVASTPIAVLSGNTLPTAPANTYITFDLSSLNIKLEAGQLYGFRFGFDGPADASDIAWTYVGGMTADYYERTPAYSITYDNTTGLPGIPTRVNGIAVYYIAEAIPEPGTTALLGGAAVGVGALLLRRKKP